MSNEGKFEDISRLYNSDQLIKKGHSIQDGNNAQFEVSFIQSFLKTSIFCLAIDLQVNC